MIKKIKKITRIKAFTRFVSILFSLFILVENIKAQEKFPLYLDERKPIELRVEDALSRMTLEEKVSITHAQSKFSSYGVPRLGIPELWMSDGPNGIREEIEWNSWDAAGWTNDSCTAFPALTCLAATWNPTISYMFGNAIGEEARYRNKNILLGPGVNIYRTPLNGRNLEYMGEDPYLSSKMVVPYIKGVQENGVAACVKHFALNNQETGRNFINVQLSDRALNEIYLPAFKAAVQDGGVMSIMAAYNKFRGPWCAENDLLLNKILKNDWKFKGVVISDWDALHNTMNGANNGLDLEMGTYLSEGKTYDDYFMGLPYLELLKSGKAKIEDLDDKARRILTLIFKTAMNRNKPWGSFGSVEHALVARKIAEEGIVLLQNKRNVLPLDVQIIKSIAVIGENATRKMTVGGGSSSLKAKNEISPLEGLKNKVGDKIQVKYVQGYSYQTTKNDSLLPLAIETAKNADIVLFFGGLSKDEGQDCEGMDRKDYRLPFGQNELIEELCKVNKNVVVVLISGNAVAMPWADKVSSIVQAWYCGSEAGNAIANVITGKVNPSGKLPFTINKQLNDYGAHFLGAYPGDSVNVNYREDILVGYRWNDTKNIEPKFCFGHGLSYTNFTYGKVKIDKKTITTGDTLKITVPVKNTGLRRGAEVVQLYISDLKVSVLRPVKELKAFRKIELQPDEEKSVTFEITKSNLEFYNDVTGKWTAESGLFKIVVGSSSRDIHCNVDFVLKE
ncbi:MAG: glycoside hydrolase family 3 C-terminal domain-containing protein [Paludibacter sp.]